MFRALICQSSGVCNCVVELPHWLISFLVCCVLELGCGSAGVVSWLPASAGWLVGWLVGWFGVLVGLVCWLACFVGWLVWLAALVSYFGVLVGWLVWFDLLVGMVCWLVWFVGWLVLLVGWYNIRVVVQQHSRKLLKMGILMPETC